MSINQKLELRNFDVRNEKLRHEQCLRVAGDWVASRQERNLLQWKAKGECSRGDQCSFRHESHDRAKPTPKTGPPSEPPTPRGRIKKSDAGCKFGTECWFPRWKVEEQPNKRPKKGGDKSAVAIVKSVRQLGCLSQDAGPPESATISRKSTKFWDQFDEYDTQEVRCVKQTSEKTKVHRWKNTSQTSSSAQSLRREIWGPISGRDRKTRAMRPGRRVETCQEYLSAQRNGKSYILFAFRWVGFAGRIHNKAGGKRVCGGLRSKHAYGQQERPWLCRSGNRNALKMPDNGSNSPRRGSNKRRGNSVCQGIGFIRDSNASRRFTGSSFTRKLCEDHGFYYHSSSGQKPHLIKNGRTPNFAPFVVPGLSISSSNSFSPTSPTSSSQESVTSTEQPALTRSGSMSEEVQGNLSHGPAEIENPNKNDDNEELRGNLSHGLPGTVW